MTVSRRHLLVVLVTLALAAMGGCASLSESECRGGDWQSIGYRDGVEGETGAKLAEHQDACTKYGITPDLAAYSAGRDAGLKVFCTPRNAFRFGARGSLYEGQCPSDLELAFRGAYEEGHQLHGYELAASEAKRDVDRIEQSMRDIERELDDINYHLNDRSLSDGERDRLYRRGQQLAYERGRLQSDRYHYIDVQRDQENALYEFRRHLQQHPRYRDWTEGD